MRRTPPPGGVFVRGGPRMCCCRRLACRLERVTPPDVFLIGIPSPSRRRLGSSDSTSHPAVESLRPELKALGLGVRRDDDRILPSNHRVLTHRLPGFHPKQAVDARMFYFDTSGRNSSPMRVLF